MPVFRNRLIVISLISLGPVLAYSSPRFHLPPVDLRPSDLASSFPELQPAARIATCRQQLDLTTHELGVLQSALQDLGAALKLQEAQQRDFPKTLSAAESRQEALLRQLNEQRELAAEAEVLLRDFRTEMTLLLTEGQSKVDQIAKDYLTKESTKIDQARQERNDARRQVGAMPEGQDEAILARRLKKKSQDGEQQVRAEAATRFIQPIRIREAQLLTALSRVQQEIAQTQSDLSRLRVEIADYRRRRDDAPDVVAGTRAEIQRTSTSIADLMSRKTAQQEALEIAVAAVKVERDQSQERLIAISPVPVNAPVIDQRADLYANYPPTRPVGFPSRGNSHPGWNSGYASVPSLGGYEYVRSYTRSNGTVVPGHYRTHADSSSGNNWSSVGNRNPFTGKRGTHRL